MLNDKLSVNLAGILGQIGRSVGLADARLKAEPVKLGKLPINRRVHAAVPMSSEGPVG